MPDHYKHSQEYADVALEELQYEKHQQQRMSSDDEQVEESSEC